MARSLVAMPCTPTRQPGTAVRRGGRCRAPAAPRRQLHARHACSLPRPHRQHPPQPRLTHLCQPRVHGARVRMPRPAPVRPRRRPRAAARRRRSSAGGRQLRAGRRCVGLPPDVGAAGAGADAAVGGGRRGRPIHGLADGWALADLQRGAAQQAGAVGVLEAPEGTGGAGGGRSGAIRGTMVAWV
jgi:hypothetical protein